MTAAQVAETLHARTVAPARRKATYPAHTDSTSSLSISQCSDVRKLVRCRAGSETDVVLEAAGLRMADLFAGLPPAPEQLHQAAQQRERRVAHRRACGRRLEAAPSVLCNRPHTGERGEQESRL